MSFSSEVKEELSKHHGKSRHCQIAELSALIAFCGKAVVKDEGAVLLIKTENSAVAQAAVSLIRGAFGTEAFIDEADSSVRKTRLFVIRIQSAHDARRILKAVKLIDEQGEVMTCPALVNNLVIQQGCCKQAFIRGAFLAAGSISAPEKFYHFEIVCNTVKGAEQMRDILNSFELDSKIVERKNHFVVYIKEGDKIVDVLNIMGAHVALMNLENVRIVKEMRNSVNRQVNCETANINKTVSAAVKQVEDIEYLQSVIGLDSLPAQLSQIARLRLENKEASLKELGFMLDPPVGKSGVNHRLRKIGVLADELREKKGGTYHD